MKDRLLGEVDPVVAQQWQSRGDWALPPPLTAHPSEARRRRADEPAAAPAPAPPVDGLKRLNAALWFTDSFHAAEVERIRMATDADEQFMAQFRAENPGAAEGRKPPKWSASSVESRSTENAISADVQSSASSARR
jgi:hypothetical protein